MKVYFGVLVNEMLTYNSRTYEAGAVVLWFIEKVEQQTSLIVLTRASAGAIASKPTKLVHFAIFRRGQNGHRAIRGYFLVHSCEFYSDGMAYIRAVEVPGAIVVYMRGIHNEL